MFALPQSTEGFARPECSVAPIAFLMRPPAALARWADALDTKTSHCVVDAVAPRDHFLFDVSWGQLWGQQNAP